MVAQALQLPLLAAPNHARRSAAPVYYNAIHLNPSASASTSAATEVNETNPSAAQDTAQDTAQDPQQVVNLWVTFHGSTNLSDAFFVVVIEPEVRRSFNHSLQEDNLSLESIQQITDLEAELRRTRESLQVSVEELEATNEEQQALNEELMASNEELQSTNEEAQSVNEELYTVNAEYQLKIQELTELNSDIDNLLASTNIGVVFLDRDLQIRKFTPAATQAFFLESRDLGRPLHHLSNNLQLQNLQPHLQTVLDTGEVWERTVRIRDSKTYLLMRVGPYVSSHQAVDGVLITLVDVTQIQQARRFLAEKNALLKTVLDTSPDLIFVKDKAGRYQMINEAGLRLVGKPSDQVLGQDDCALFPVEDVDRIQTDDQRILAEGGAVTYEECIHSSTCEETYFLTTKAIYRNDVGDVLGLVGYSRDITPIKQAQADLERANASLQAEILKRQEALQALQDSEQRFRSAFEQAAVGIAHVAPDGTLIRLNQRFANIVGYSKAELLGGKTFQEITHPDDLEQDLVYVGQMLRGEISSYSMEKRYLCRDGRFIWANLTVSLLCNQQGDPQYFVAVIQDIGNAKNLERERDRILHELSWEKELAQVTLHSISDAVITTDPSGQIHYCNPVAEQLTGWKNSNAMGKPIQEVLTLMAEESSPLTHHPVLAVLASPATEVQNASWVLVSRSGVEFMVSVSVTAMHSRQDNLIGVVAIIRDVTESRRLSQELTWQASHDPLTGLVNRRQFEQDLIAAINDCQSDDRIQHTLCYLDLDQFKIINDTSGHLAGDELLRQIALLIKNQVRTSDHVARLGGDEFGLLLKGCYVSQAEKIVNQLREAIHGFRFVWQGRTYSLGVSAGLVALDTTLSDLELALSAADAACHLAKEKGRNQIYVYQADDVDVTRQRHEQEWSVRIRQAIEQNQFCLYAQPIAWAKEAVPSDPQDNCPCCEILLRMVDAVTGELIPPSVFIPAAERYDLMPLIDRWVIRTFWDYLASGIEPAESTAPSLTYMINLSGASLTDNTFLLFLQQILQASPAFAPHVCFEITETAAISNLTQVVDFINETRKLGCQFALDDFGSGMSSFGYLQVLPVDYIKIDGSFIRKLATDSTARIIAESINRIGQNLGLKTIAEAVESDAIKLSLQQLNVDYMQGYAIALPQFLCGKQHQ